MAKPEKNKPSVWRHQLGRAMSGTHKADSHPRKERWRVPVLIITSALVAVLFYIGSRTKSEIKIELSLRRWGIGRVVVIESESGAEITRRTWYRVGPLGFLRTQRIALVVLGTDELRVDDIGYNPPDRREPWRVLAVEKQHEFEDGTARPGVRLRFVNGGEAWVPREKIGKALVGR